jgi:tetratricopeptide (TPR) repeat protein
LATVVAACLVIGWSAHWPAQGAAGAAKPDASKAGPGKLVEKWLSKQMMQELDDASEKGKYEDLSKHVDAVILERLACGHLDQMEALADLVFVRRACKYLPMADKLDDTKKFSPWLMKNHEVTRLLFRALPEMEKPEAAIEKLHTLWKKDEKRVAAYGNLSVAFATTTCVSRWYKQPNATDYVKSFDWYTDNPKVPFRIDLKAAPYEISRYLTNTNLSLDERKWAVHRYANKHILAAAYFDVRYDYDVLKGEPKKISKLDFTLQNLADPKVGGVCIEQAYYSSEVCKALGQPATIVCGTGARGGHAWLACLILKRVGQGWQAMWDSTTARYPYDNYFVGDLYDPVTGKNMQDCELILIGAAAQLPLERKEQADAACELAQFVSDQVKNKANVKELVELPKLADAYTKRMDATDKNAPKADVTEWSVTRKIDSSLVESMINQSIEANLAHRQAWDLVIAMQKAQEISPQTTGKFLDTLITRTGKEYPDYSANMVAQIVPTLQEPASREKVYKKAIAFYGARPDLQGQLSVALADDLYEQGKKDEALKIYGQVAAGNMKFAQIVMDASAHAETRLTKDNNTATAIKMYTQLFSMLRKPHEDWDYYESTYYQLGNRLVAVLKKDGQQDAADKISDKISTKEEKAKK